MIALIGRLRYAERRSVPEIRTHLVGRRVSVSERTVTNLLDRYDELLAVASADDRRLRKVLASQKKVILAIDGLHATGRRARGAVGASGRARRRRYSSGMAGRLDLLLGDKLLQFGPAIFGFCGARLRGLLVVDVDEHSPGEKDDQTNKNRSLPPHQTSSASPAPHRLSTGHSTANSGNGEAMTEAEWLACRNPEAMLEIARFGSSDRKLRLFAVACVDAITSYLSSTLSKAALDVLDLYAEGKCSRTELHQAWESALAALREIIEDASEQKWYYVGVYAADAVALATNPDLAENITTAAARCVHTLMTACDSNQEREVRAGECARQVHLIRDIFGNPFRLVAAEPAWLTSTVVALAKGIYEERAFDRMPILADAIQDAGCEDPDVLNHCRGPGPHVRGCWVVDLVLGKS